MTDEAYKVKLENVFEGPMDLLVHLIKKNEVDIYDIPIALITDQYLSYLKWMNLMNIDYAGDFIVMAATLAQIKSKMLLPVHDENGAEEDPRLEITKPLMEYLQLKSAAEYLVDRNILGENTFIRQPNKMEYAINPDEEIIKVGLFELIDAFQKILDNISPEHRVDLTADRLTIKEKITEIIDILEKKGSSIFSELFSPNAEKSEVIVTFLAILEMVKLNLIRVAQHVQTGIIRLFYI
jgi:segregation and condensation protein A